MHNEATLFLQSAGSATQMLLILSGTNEDVSIGFCLLLQHFGGFTNVCFASGS